MAVTREGSLEAPTRHPLNWKDASFYDKDDLFNELDGRGIRVVSLRNKANRLEELFMGLVEGKQAAAGSKEASA